MCTAPSSFGHFIQGNPRVRRLPCLSDRRKVAQRVGPGPRCVTPDGRGRRAEGRGIPGRFCKATTRSHGARQPARSAADVARWGWSADGAGRRASSGGGPGVGRRGPARSVARWRGRRPGLRPPPPRGERAVGPATLKQQFVVRREFAALGAQPGDLVVAVESGLSTPVTPLAASSPLIRRAPPCSTERTWPLQPLLGRSSRTSGASSRWHTCGPAVLNHPQHGSVG